MLKPPEPEKIPIPKAVWSTFVSLISIYHAGSTCVEAAHQLRHSLQRIDGAQDPQVLFQECLSALRSCNLAVSSLACLAGNFKVLGRSAAHVAREVSSATRKSIKNRSGRRQP